MERGKAVLLLQNFRARMGIRTEQVYIGKADFIPTREVTFTTKEAEAFNLLFGITAWDMLDNEHRYVDHLLLQNLRERAGILSPEEKDDLRDQVPRSRCRVLFTQQELAAFDRLIWDFEDD